MHKKIKTISFISLILGLGLVLSACNKEDLRVKKQENLKDQLQQEESNKDNNVSVSSPSDNLINSDDSNKEKGDLFLSKWRTYQNEYFNLKLKYHYNWYFHKVKKNDGNKKYIAVYDFFPNLESLKKNEYAIRLFILNDQDTFNGDFSVVKDKIGQGKKYILVSNNVAYEEILKAMFDNLEIINNKE